jgi:hypothetical protein
MSKAGELARIGWMGSTEFIVMRPKPTVPAEYAYFPARENVFREHVIRSMTGTSGRQRVQADSVAASQIAAPPDDKIRRMFPDFTALFPRASKQTPGHPKPSPPCAMSCCPR